MRKCSEMCEFLIRVVKIFFNFIRKIYKTVIIIDVIMGEEF